MDDLDAVLAVAVQAARAGADVALEWQRRGGLQVEEKSGVDDLVSQADRDSEAAVVAVLRDARPQDGVVAEEGARRDAAPGSLLWLVDPIDGTTNYLYGLDAWAVSVAAVEVAPDGSPGAPVAAVVLEPVTGRATTARRGGGTWCDGVQTRVRPTADLRHALVDTGFGRRPYRQQVGRLAQRLAGDLRDVRRLGSAATGMALVATGRTEGYWGPGVSAWDIAAGALLVTEAGGVVGTLDGATGEGLPGGGVCLAAGPALFEPLRGLLAEVYADVRAEQQPYGGPVGGGS